MPYAPLLSPAEITQGLAELPEWWREGETIVRTVKSDSFLEAIALVNGVATAAEEADHHPDIHINWRRVTFTLTTHASKGLTGKDLAMARRIDELAATSADLAK